MRKIIPTRTPDFESTPEETMTSLGTHIVQTSRGPVTMCDAPGMNTGLATGRPGVPDTVVVMVYDAKADIDGVGVGMICQLSPDAARTLGASLLKLADQLDPRKPH